MRIAVIGGGSVYTPELAEGLLSRAGELGLEELVLMDIDRERLGVVGGLVRRMAAKGDPFPVRITTSLSEALEGADIVIVQIRVGGNVQRACDERICLELGVVGQETTGPAGFANALRTVPRVLEIAHRMERLCPDAWLLVFTNPAGIVTQAVLSHAAVRAVGLCNVPINMRYGIARWFGVEPHEVHLDYAGLNHLGWAFGVEIRGEDMTQEAVERFASECADNGGHPFDPELIRTLGCIPSYYLRYFYHHDRVVREQRESGKTRGEEVLEIERTLLSRFRDPGLSEKPLELSRRGGALYSRAALDFILGLLGKGPPVQVLNVANRGAIPDLPGDAVVEVPCRVRPSGPEPIPRGSLPPWALGLVQSIKAYEAQTVAAAMEGDRGKALSALLMHPLVGDYDKARALLVRLLAASRRYLPQFFGK